MTLPQDLLKTKLEGYLKKAESLFQGLRATRPEGEVDWGQKGNEFREMALAYYSDALHFYALGEYVNALAALEYAEGWLDAGRKIGVLSGKREGEL